MYTIWERYEHRTNEGKKFTPWFQLCMVNPTNTKEELIDLLKKKKEDNKYTMSKTGGLKIECKIDEFIEPH